MDRTARRRIPHARLMACAGLILSALVLLHPPFPLQAQTAYQPRSLPAPGASTCPGGLCGGAALTPLFQALSDLEQGRRRAPVRILQIGDSHTAGDRITGAARARLQARFGRGGRGVLAPAFDGGGFQVQVAAGGWRLETAALQPPGGRPGPAFGLSGRRAAGGGAEPAWITLTAEPGAEIGVVGVCARTTDAGQARFAVSAGALPRRLVFDGPAPACHALVLDHGAASLRLDLHGAGLIVDSLWVEQTGPGLTFSSLGVVGASLRDMEARDEAVAAAELAAWSPTLIVLAYGTNEGFEDGLDAAAYEALLRAQIARLRRLSPGSAVLILGAPDALRRGVQPACSGQGGGAHGPPPALAVVRDVQRRVADDTGVAFWDWRERMGGDCAAERLAGLAAPLMRPDRVHFTGEGADWIGAVLADDLTAAYEAWRSATR